MSRMELLKQANALNIRLAGSAFKSYRLGMTAGLREAHQAVEGALNLINYRLHGEGSRDDFTGQPTLDDQQKRQAQDIARKLKEVDRAIEDAAGVVHKNGRGIESLDDFMKFV